MLRYTMSKSVLEGSTCSGTFRSQLSRGSTCAGMAADSSESGYFNTPKHSGFLGVNMLRNIQGGQYLSNNMKKLVHTFTLEQSMSRADDPYDNAGRNLFGAAQGRVRHAQRWL
jgi:glutamine amidotransferase PdxT